MKNWKTTLSGIASIISGISLYLNHPDQIEAAIAAVTLGFGLLFAKDHNVSGGPDKSIRDYIGGRPNDRP